MTVPVVSGLAANLALFNWECDARVLLMAFYDDDDDNVNDDDDDDDHTCHMEYPS